MKKFNKNILLFIACFLFLIAGLCSKQLVIRIGSSAKNLCLNIVSGQENALQTFTKEIDSTSELLKYRNAMLDLSSVKDNLLGNRIMFESETTVVKADSGTLLGYLSTTPDSEESLQSWVKNIKDFQTLAESNGAGFLYCVIPEKSSYETLPSNYNSYSAEKKNDILKRSLTTISPALIP